MMPRMGAVFPRRRAGGPSTEEQQRRPGPHAPTCPAAIGARARLGLLIDVVPGRAGLIAELAAEVKQAASARLAQNYP